MSRIKQIKEGLLNKLVWTSQNNTKAKLSFDGTVFETDKGVRLPDGSAAAPSLSFNGNPFCGIFSTSNCVNIATAACERVVIDGQGDLNIRDGRGIEGGAGSTGGYFATFMPALGTDNIAAAAGGAIAVTTYCTTINTDGGGDAFTLTDGKVIGHLKKIYLIADGGGDGVVTGHFNVDGAATTLTFSDAGEYAILMWNGTGWVGIELGSVMTITHAPVIS